MFKLPQITRVTQISQITTRWGVVAFALAAGACSDATGPTGADSAVGVYLLQSLNNLAMPVPLGSFFGYSLEYTSSRMTLKADSTYQERSIITERVDGSVVQVDTADANGLWLQTDTLIVLFDVEVTDQIRGKYKNGTLTFDVIAVDSTYHYVYKKQ